MIAIAIGYNFISMVQATGCRILIVFISIHSRPPNWRCLSFLTTFNPFIRHLLDLWADNYYYLLTYLPTTLNNRCKFHHCCWQMCSPLNLNTVRLKWFHFELPCSFSVRRHFVYIENGHLIIYCCNKSLFNALKKKLNEKKINSFLCA